MDWLYRLLLLLISIAFGVENAEREMARLEPPAMPNALYALLRPIGPPPPPPPPPPPLSAADVLGGMP